MKLIGVIEENAVWIECSCGYVKWKVCDVEPGYDLSKLPSRQCGVINIPLT